ncbi:uncharacterized protein ACBT44_013575 isoform 1-T1 [Syngnathus typhle]
MTRMNPRVLFETIENATMRHVPQRAAPDGLFRGTPALCEQLKRPRQTSNQLFRGQRNILKAAESQRSLKGFCTLLPHPTRNIHQTEHEHEMDFRVNLRVCQLPHVGNWRLARQMKVYCHTGPASRSLIKLSPGS